MLTWQRAAQRLGVALLVAVVPLSLVRAKPSAPGVLCETYPDMPECMGRVPACALCHESTDPPSWNAFGQALKGQLTAGMTFESALRAALEAVAEDDADADGATNLEELLQGSQPSVPDAQSGAPQGSLPNPRYRIGDYDALFALRRVGILYCGRSPSYEELQTFQAGAPDAATLKQRLHQKLDSCLRGEYWRSEGLARLADKKIRPVRAFGKDTDIFIGSVRLVIGDYDYDYNLWRYALTDHHDMRELLTAQYHVVRAEDGSLQKVTGVLEKADPKGVAGGQPVPPERRAGLLTTQWFLAYSTMFSALPRVTAAQAYRAYLGADIANTEGLRPVAGEPVDVDDKGVDDPRCASCHSTLDPLSYAFAEYEGVVLNLVTPFGSYNAGRPRSLMSAWDVNRQKSMLLGKPAKNLVEWGKVASESDEFRRAIADMFFRHALDRAPRPDELNEFNALWQRAPDDGYSADRMLHRLIDTHAFGSP